MNYKGHLVKPSKNPDGNPCFRIYSTQAKDKLIGEAPSLSLALKEIDRLTEGQSFKPNPFRQALNESSLKSNLGDKPQIDDEKPRKEWLLTVQQCGEIFGLPDTMVRHCIWRESPDTVKIGWRVWIKVGWIDHFIEALGYTMEFSKVLNDRLDRAVEDNLQRSVVIESAKTFLLKEIASRQMVVKDSLPFLRSKGLSWQEARDLLKSNDGILWSMRKIYRQGNPKLLIPLKG